MQSRRIQQPQTGGAIALISAVLMGTAASLLCPSIALASSLADPSTTGQMNPLQIQAQTTTSQLPQRISRRVRRDLAQRLNQAPRTFRVVDASSETWPDSCLGLAAPNERCAMALVEGWRVELTNGEQNWVYRTDRTAQVIKLETQDTATLPIPVVERLFETIAAQANVPANTLKVVESQPRTWNGCMGIFEPGRACTQIAIPGYRVIVMGDRQSWVYHVNQDGSQIVQNTTASGSGNAIMPSFFPDGSEPSVPTQDIVFQMTVSGGIAGDVTETILTSEGILYRRSTGMRASAMSAPTILKRLSQEQVAQFQQILQQEKFPNLNGMRYLTPEALADYPTTTIQAMGSSVAYVDLAQNDLPQSLQTVLQAWTQL